MNPWKDSHKTPNLSWPVIRMENTRFPQIALGSVVTLVSSSSSQLGLKISITKTQVQVLGKEPEQKWRSQSFNNREYTRRPRPNKNRPGICSYEYPEPDLDRKRHHHPNQSHPVSNTCTIYMAQVSGTWTLKGADWKKAWHIWNVLPKKNPRS